MKTETDMKDISIAVHGLGYIGLPTACLFAQAGFQVYGIDVNEHRVKELSQGILPFLEPGLDELFQAVKNNMKFSTSPVAADVYIIAVPTPLDRERNRADLQAVKEATTSIAAVARDGDAIIIESTIPPRTCFSLISKIFEESGKQCKVAHCPERAFTGKTLQEMIENDRMIGCSQEDRDFFRSLYASFVKGKIWLTDALTAECIKLLENTYRDVNVAFANEIVRMSEQIGVNAWEVIELANKHPRVSILQPSIGVGGHCLPIDPWFLLETGVESKFIELSRSINDSVPFRIADIILKNSKQGEKVGMLGVAYKKNVGDHRETPATSIIKKLLDTGRTVRVTDPFVTSFWYEKTDLEEVLQWSECVVLSMNHDAYSSIDFSRYPNIKTLVDCHNFYHSIPDTMKLIKIGTPLDNESNL